MAARQWTPEQRKEQSLKIRQWKPWEHSTGAKTLAGKAIASRNAFKGGFAQQLKGLRKTLKKHKQNLEQI